MEFGKEYILILGPITAAMIAGGISFIATILSKDQKTSEFRQAWIDSFRSEISELLALAGTYVVMVNRFRAEKKSSDEIIKFLSDNKDDMTKVDTLIIKTKLRLNPTEHSKLLYMINFLEKESLKQESKEHSKIIENLTNESQKILKMEWGRVKRGEVSFIALKWASLVSFILSMIFITLYLSNHLNIEFIQ
ncbi:MULTISPECIES: hypothetical protein [Aeromonas]|uniref:hypothetical protein n=1 Tax=Aeromonas TaxID=642 RepID=UPI0012F2707A|nr:hypothetical protein [Aeromonas salmonicida]VXA81169.1 conserved membrane hypothetical protein [Aeromonas salmonicida]